MRQDKSGNHVAPSNVSVTSDHAVSFGVPLSGSAEKFDADHSGQLASLRCILPSARFHVADEIQFVSVAASAASAMPGDLVVYRIGESDPMRVVADAMARGAAGILTEQLLPCPLPQCLVGDIDLAMASITAEMLDRPDQKLLTIGVIGSAGKTTTALLLSTLMRSQSIHAAHQTDLGTYDGVKQTTSKHGLPSGTELVDWMGEAVKAECQVAIMELSDDDARHGRYDAIEFDMLVVTGSTLATEDFGPTGLSCALERLASEGVVVAPVDDARAMRVIEDADVRCVTYGVLKSADVTAKIIDQSDGLSTLLMTHDDTTAAMETPLCGGAMAANHAAAATVGLLIDLPLATIAEKLGSLRSVPGRGQRLSRFGHSEVTLDVAGSVDRCAAAMRAARATKGAGRLWVVLAISDQDDSAMLARLGNLLERFSDQAVLTSVPDRKTSFLAASHSVLDGVQKCAAMRLVADQKRAIRWAVGEARPSDSILVLTNHATGTAHQQRTELEAIETLVKKTWDKQETKQTTPKLKVFK